MRLAPGELDEPVAEGDGGEGLAAAGRHLDQGARAVVGQGRFEVLDALDPGPATDARCSAAASRRSSATHLLVELDEADQFFGPVEGEDVPAAGVRLQGVREVRDVAGGLVGEGQRQAVMRQARRAGRPGTCRTAFRRR